MPGPVTVKIEGGKELEEALGALADEYGKASGKAVLRRVGKKALEPMAETARRLAPDDPNTPDPDLESSITVGTKLTPRQARLARKDQNKSTVTIYMGTSDPSAVFGEFGTVYLGPQPFIRPAYEQHKEEAVRIVGKELGPEIEKTAARLAKRRAKKAAANGS